MRIFGFDLRPNPEQLDHLNVDSELPYSLPEKRWSRVVVDLVTHDAGGITALDCELASRAQELAGAAR